MDKKLQGHVILHQSVFSELQCEDLCIRVPGCLAYNYHYSGEMAEKDCELMNEVRVVNNTLGYSFRLFERERVLKVSNSYASLMCSVLVLETKPVDYLNEV